MSILEKSSSSRGVRDIDPLLKDLNERKQSFRRNVVSLAVELKEARTRLLSQEQSFAQETLTRQVLTHFAIAYYLWLTSYNYYKCLLC